MHLLFTLQNFPPSNFGGIAMSMTPLIEKLSMNHEIDVLTTSYQLPDDFSLKFNLWINTHNFRVKYIKSKHRLFSTSYIFHGLSIIKNYDQVHLSSLFFFPNLIFATFAILNNRKVYWSFHGELLKPALRIKYWKKFIYLFFIRTITKYLFIRATSKDEAIRVEEVLGKSHIKIIPNFFDIDVVCNLKKNNQLMFLGRISPIKKIENLILACSKSKLFIDKEYKLIVGGPKDDKFIKYFHSIIRQINELDLQEQIFLIGNLKSPEKERYLAQSKALFLVSDSENFGNVVIEALAQGTPVIATKGTPWSILETTGSGFWIDNSPIDIACCIDKLIGLTEEKYQEMCQNASHLAKMYSSEAVMGDWLRFIHEVHN